MTQAKQSIWVYPNELNAEPFNSGELQISTLLTLLNRKGINAKQDLSISIEQLVNDPSLHQEYQVKLVMPMPRGSYYLLTSTDADQWFSLFDRCLEVLKNRSDARLVTGCDWDEYNITNFNNTIGNDLIVKILERFRQNNILLNRLTWLHCNTMIPDWIAERVGPNEQLPQTIYNSNYLYYMKDLEQQYQPTVNDEKHSKKTHWFLCLNRRAHIHRLFLTFWWSKHGYRPAYFSCRLGHADDNEPGLDYSNLDDEGYQLIRNFYKNNEQDLDLYRVFCDSLPWVIDNPGHPVGFEYSLELPIIESSACYICTETQFTMTSHGIPLTTNYEGFISEKTLKSFFYGLPTLWVSSPDTVKSVKKLGFASYEPLINESYDSEVDGQQRMAMICDEIIRIQNINDINHWYRSGKEIYQNNRKRFDELVNQDVLAQVDEFHNTYCGK